jgi:hypothetical protein
MKPGTDPHTFADNTLSIFDIQEDLALDPEWERQVMLAALKHRLSELSSNLHQLARERDLLGDIRKQLQAGTLSPMVARAMMRDKGLAPPPGRSTPPV